MTPIEQLAIDELEEMAKTHPRTALQTAYGEGVIAGKALQQSSEPCSSCNDTGDIHSADGQYAGKCPCKQSSEPVAFDEIETMILYDMNKAFKLGNLHMDGLPIDDTQLGVEFALEKVKPLFTQPPNTVNLEQYNKLLDALRDAKSVINSINRAKMYELNIPSDDEPVYYQRKEWVDWAYNEILPKVNHAIVEAERSDK